MENSNTDTQQTTRPSPSAEETGVNESSHGVAAEAFKEAENLLGLGMALAPEPEPEAAPSTPQVQATGESPTTSATERSPSQRLAVPLVLNDPTSDGSAAEDLKFSSYADINDPFRNHTYKLSRWGKFKLYCLGPIVIPVRIAGTVAILSAGAFLGSIAQFGLEHGGKASGKKGSTGTEPRKKDQKPLSGIRRFIASGIFRLARCLLFNFGFHYIKVTGEKDPKATVLVCNHMGPFEAAAIFHFSRATVVSRIENASIPLLGSILKSIQCIFVNRNSVESRDDTISQIHERATAPPGTWPPLLIFPEGTTGNGKSILRFRTGAFIPGVPVQPIVAKFRFKDCDPSWCDQRLGMAPTILRVMAQFYTYLELQYLPTYYPSEAEKADPNLYAENVRQYMCSKGGIPASNYSLDDYFVLAEAYRQNIPQSEALLGMEMLRKEANITASDVKRIIKAFGELDTSKKGKIGYAAFLKYLGMPDTVVTRTIFAEVVASGEKAEAKSSKNNSFDDHVVSSESPTLGASASNSIGSPTVSDAVQKMMNDIDFAVFATENPNARAITFRQFLRAIVKINKSMSTEDKVSQAFDIINFTGTGKISKEEMMAMFDFAAVEMTPAQVKEIYNRMDSRRMGYVDKIEFGAFMRANPIYIAMFEAARRYEREKDSHNPVVQALVAKANKEPVTVDTFKQMVKAYRERQKAAQQNAESLMYF